MGRFYPIANRAAPILVVEDSAGCAGDRVSSIHDVDPRLYLTLP
jgi:hypothetical protein